MRIAQISINYKPILGGQEVYVDELNGVIERAGWEWRVFQRDNGYKDPRITLVSYPKPLRPVMGFNLGLLKHIAQLKKYEKLIIHYPDHFPTLSWHKRTIVLTHGVNWELDGQKKKKRRIQLAKMALKNAWQFVANDTHFYRTMGLDIAPATRFFEEIAPGKWFIPNCVNTQHFSATTPLQEIQKRNAILVPRNITPARGVDLAVAAFIEFHKEHPDTSLYIAGSALPNTESQEYKASIEAMVKQAGLEDCVVFYGSVDHAKMPELFSSAIMTVIPTRANEGTALSALESMSCGTPTVVTAVAGLRDLPALQAEPTPEALAQAMGAIMRERERFAQEQQAAVREQFSLERWEAAWKRVMEQK